MPICKVCNRFTAPTMQKRMDKECIYCDEVKDRNTLDAYL